MNCKLCARKLRGQIRYAITLTFLKTLRKYIKLILNKDISYWGGNFKPETPRYKIYSVNHSMEQERYFFEVSFLDYFLYVLYYVYVCK